MHYRLYPQIFAVVTMALAAYVEEIIFRGFLYKVIEKDNVKQAIVISAVTFGAGHIVNLFTGRQVWRHFFKWDMHYICVKYKIVVKQMRNNV